MGNASEVGRGAFRLGGPLGERDEHRLTSTGTGRARPHSERALDPVQLDRWLRELALNGFIVLENFLPVELVRRMGEELRPLLEAEHARAEADGYAKGRLPGRLALHVGPFADVMRGALADERYRRNPVIEELVTAVMGEGGWTRGWTVVEAAWPGSQFMSWHSDQKREDTPDLHAPGSGLRLAFNIPLVDFTWSSGAMEILPGSHHLPRSFRTVADLPRIHPVRLELRAGDAILRDANCLHRGTPNLGERVRPMLDQTYKRVASARVGARSGGDRGSGPEAA